MSKTVLIIEKDRDLSHAAREAFEARGFSVEESSDGKGAPDLIRSSRPDCVVLAVDLDAGQNGYIICKKLKSDGDLKEFPIVIVGDPKGFAQHQKMRTRADDYLAKPFEAPQLVDRVGGLVGFPPEPEASPDGAFDDGGFDPSSLIEEEGVSTSSEEIAIESEETVGSADPDFEMVDAIFEDKPAGGADEELAAFDGTDDLAFLADEDDSAEKTVVGFLPPAATHVQSIEPPPFHSSGSLSGADADTRELRAKVTELTGALDDARERSAQAEARVRELEADLESRDTELEAARASGGKSDSKEIFALRDSLNKKDKEIVRLKSELNEREEALVELRGKENQLEQQASESAGELARRDAQVKTLQTRADQLSGERRKFDQQLLQAREEARSAQAMVTTLQADLDAYQTRAVEADGELAALRDAQNEAEATRLNLETELSEARGEIEALKTQLDQRSNEAEETRAHLEQAQMDLDSARTQLTTQATTFADEIGGLRQRMAQAEATATRSEEKASRHAERLKAQAEQLERLRQTLKDTLAGLEAVAAEDLDLDELVEA